MKTNARAEAALKALYHMALDEAKDPPGGENSGLTLAGLRPPVRQPSRTGRRFPGLWLAAALALFYAGTSIALGDFGSVKTAGSYAGIEVLSQTIRESVLINHAVEYFQQAWHLESGKGEI